MKLEVGQALYYWPDDSEDIRCVKGVPLHATVAYVSRENVVNLNVLDMRGGSNSRIGVLVVPPDGERPKHSHATLGAAGPENDEVG